MTAALDGRERSGLTLPGSLRKSPCLNFRFYAPGATGAEVQWPNARKGKAGPERQPTTGKHAAVSTCYQLQVPILQSRKQRDAKS